MSSLILKDNFHYFSNTGIAEEILHAGFIWFDEHGPQFKKLSICKDINISATTDNIIYKEGDKPTLVLPNIKLHISCNYDENIFGLNVCILPFLKANEDVLDFLNHNRINGYFNRDTQCLSLTGYTKIKDYQSALRKVTYYNNSKNPTIVERQIIIRGHKKAFKNNPPASKINVISVNDAPIIIASKAKISYMKCNQTVVIDPKIQIYDPDSKNITKAFVNVTEYVIDRQRSLTFTGSMPNLLDVKIYNDSMVFSGTSDYKVYQQALRKVAYHIQYDVPSHFISVQVFDDELNSNVVSYEIKRNFTTNCSSILPVGPDYVYPTEQTSAVDVNSYNSLSENLLTYDFKNLNINSNLTVNQHKLSSFTIVPIFSLFISLITIFWLINKYLSRQSINLQQSNKINEAQITQMANASKDESNILKRATIQHGDQAVTGERNTTKQNNNTEAGANLSRITTQRGEQVVTNPECNTQSNSNDKVSTDLPKITIKQRDKTATDTARTKQNNNNNTVGSYVQISEEDLVRDAENGNIDPLIALYESEYNEIKNSRTANWRAEQSLEDTQKQLNILKNQIENLEKDSTINNSVLKNKRARHSAREKFKNNPKLLQFYNILNGELNELLLATRVAATKMIKPDDIGAGGKASNVITFLANVIGAIPIIGAPLQTISKAVGTTLQVVHQQRRQNLLRKIASWGNSDEMKCQINDLAYTITERYANQIEQLSLIIDDPKSFKEKIKNLPQQVQEKILSKERLCPLVTVAEYGVLLIWEYWLNNDIDRNISLTDQLLLTLTTDTGISARLENIISEKTSLLTVSTVDYKKWTLLGFYQNPGLIVDQAKYYTGPKCKPKLYGYRLGTLDEVKSLGLSFEPPIYHLANVYRYTRRERHINIDYDYSIIKNYLGKNAVVKSLKDISMRNLPLNKYLEYYAKFRFQNTQLVVPIVLKNTNLILLHIEYSSVNSKKVCKITYYDPKDEAVDSKIINFLETTYSIKINTVTALNTKHHWNLIYQEKNSTLEKNIIKLESNVKIDLHQNPKLRNKFLYQAISGDGNCLYNAVALYVEKDQKELRKKVSEFLRFHSELFGFITLSIGQSIEDYINAVQDSEWATHVEIEILMRVLNRPIIIIGLNGNIINLRDALRFQGDPIFVYYNESNHYDGLLLTSMYSGRGRALINSLLIENGYVSVLSERDLFKIAETDNIEQLIKLYKDQYNEIINQHRNIWYSAKENRYVQDQINELKKDIIIIEEENAEIAMAIENDIDLKNRNMSNNLLLKNKRTQYHALEKFKNNPQLLEFYKNLTIRLEHLIYATRVIVAKIIQENDINSRENIPTILNDLEKIITSLSIFDEIMISIFDEIMISDIIVKGLKIILGLDNLQFRKKWLDIISFYGTHEEIQDRIIDIAQTITESYACQIMQLSFSESENTGLSIFKSNKVRSPLIQIAELGALLFWEYWTGNNINNKLLISQLLTTLVSNIGKPNQIKDILLNKIGLKRILTIDKKEWTLLGFYQKPDLVTGENQYYTKDKNVPNIYGCRFGTLEEAKVLQLNLESPIYYMIHTYQVRNVNSNISADEILSMKINYLDDNMIIEDKVDGWIINKNKEGLIFDLEYNKNFRLPNVQFIIPVNLGDKKAIFLCIEYSSINSKKLHKLTCYGSSDNVGELHPEVKTTLEKAFNIKIQDVALISDYKYQINYCNMIETTIPVNSTSSIEIARDHTIQDENKKYKLHL